MSTGSPQSIPVKTSKMHPTTSRPFCRAAHTRAHLISCVGGAIQRHHNHIRFKPSFRPYGHLPAYSASLTDMASPLTPCHAPIVTWRGAKVAPNSRYAHRVPIVRPNGKYWLVGPRPPRGNETCINAHAHNAHGTLGTPTS